MALRQCDQCSEMVDDAKAFCPACGNAFVEEEKAKATAFEEQGQTMQFGQTMYNQMLEDMGLNISDVPSLTEKRVEIIAPIEPQKSLPATRPGNAQTRPRSLKLYIVGSVVAVLLLVAAFASIILIVLNILARLAR